MNRKWLRGLLVAVVLPAAAHTVFAAGTDDPRTAVPLTAEHQAFVLQEMRAYVLGIQSITAALAREEMPAVARAAQGMGRQTMKDAPKDLMGSLPKEFRELGMSVHMAFDQLAMDAQAMGDTRHTLGQLSEVMGRCVACHAAYRLSDR